MGAINNWLRKSPAAPLKSFTQTQQSEAQLNGVVKDGEEIGAIILFLRERLLKFVGRRKNSIGTGNCPREETEGNAYQTTNRKRYHWDVECPHSESMRKPERIDVRAGQVQMGHHRTLRDAL